MASRSAGAQNNSRVAKAAARVVGAGPKGSSTGPVTRKDLFGKPGRSSKSLARASKGSGAGTQIPASRKAAAGKPGGGSGRG